MAIIPSTNALLRAFIEGRDQLVAKSTQSQRPAPAQRPAEWRRPARPPRPERVPPPPPVVPPRRRTSIYRELYSPDALRRSIIVHEVLGPPKGLRPLE